MKSDNSTAYRQLNSELIRNLLTTLELGKDNDVGYLHPLIALGRKCGGVTIGTLNYDLTIEAAAQQAGVHVSMGVEQWIDTGTLSFCKEGIRLAKLHGSISWTTSPDRQQGQLSVRPELFSPRQPGAYDLPAVIYGKRDKLRAEGPYLDLRSAFADALGASECLVAIGYSVQDEHVNAIIRRWLGRDQKRWIVILDPTPANTRGWGYDPSFAGELRNLNPLIQHYRNDSAIRPRIYPIESTAATALLRVCMPARDLRESLSGWEDSWRAKNTQ